MAKGGKSSGTRPSMQNVAAYAGVSTATVSKVLQGVPTIRPENIERVQNAIEALGYRINPLAADLRRGRRRLVGAIVPRFEDPLFGRLLTALERYAEMRGYALAATSSCGSESREVDLINRMHDWRVAGVVVASVKSEGGSAAVLLKETALPAVFIDRVIGGRAFDTVAPDYKVALEQMRKIPRFRQGRILLLHREKRDPESSSHLRRFQLAFTQLVKNAKVELLNCSGTSQVVERALRIVLDRSDRPTAVLALWAPAVLMVVNQAKLRDWKIPDDLAVAGFEPDDWMDVVAPGIASIRLPTERIAAKAIELLFRRLDRPGEAAVAALEPFQIDLGSSIELPTRDSAKVKAPAEL
jgi:LacI family transcriptional regulator